MHDADRLYWQRCKEKYARWFTQTSILEVGSYDVNGSIRAFFDAKEYVGVDWRSGPGVDVVCPARDMQFDHAFDAVISTSMLEHDIDYQASLRTMVQYVREDGILILSWGSALNGPHHLETAEDGQFHNLKTGLVRACLTDLGMYIHESFYQGELPNFVNPQPGASDERLRQIKYEVSTIVAFHDKQYAVGEPIITPLMPEDEC